MNKTLADIAEDALRAPGFEESKGYCQRWVRQVVQRTYGSKYDRYMKASAKETAQAFLAAGIGQPYRGQETQVGDILYKTEGSGGYGHVGIRVYGNMVAENSSAHWNGSDARGRRPLAAYGAFQVLVRLPDPKAAVAGAAGAASGAQEPTKTRPLPILINGKPLQDVDTATINGVSWAELRTLLPHLGWSVQYEDGKLNLFKVPATP